MYFFYVDTSKKYKKDAVVDHKGDDVIGLTE